MFTKDEIFRAAAEFGPLILFKKTTHAEKNQGTRSFKSIYQVRILASSTQYGSKRESVWHWGGGSLDSNFHLALIGMMGDFSGTITFPPDSENIARETFKMYDDQIKAINSKFLSMASMRAGAEGKADIYLAKIRKSTGNDGKRLSLEIIKNFSSKETGLKSIKVANPPKLEEEKTNIIAIRPSLFGGKVLESREVAPEEIDFITRLYVERLYFLKKPVSKIHADS